MSKKYPIDQSPFYCLRSKKKLAELLGISSVSKLQKLSSDDFYKEVVNDGKKFTPPVGVLRYVHNRIQILLSRIVTPDYLHSAVKGRSNLTNALSHSDAYGMVKTDIRQFFPSTPASKIKRFFLYQMRCSPDVACLLSELLTVGGFLPKGSPCSTTLAFWANKQMFDELYQISKSVNANLTLYVDDVSVSMKGLDSNLLRRINGIIRRNGYQHHKHRIYRPSQPKVVTGIVLENGKCRVKKGVYRKLRNGEDSDSSKGRRAYIQHVESTITPHFGDKR